jgi:hypothetical protein
MTRRRLILAACVAVVALGAAWWLTSERLTEDERSLVGTWRFSATVGNRVWTFRPDGRARLDADGPGSLFTGRILDCHWTATARELTLDSETSWVRRTLRPLLQRFGEHIDPPIAFTVVSRTENQVIVKVPITGAQVWTRDRGD